MKTQFITDDKGQKQAIILPIAEYEKLMEELEELEDIKLYDKVKSNKEEYISFDDFLKSRKVK
ncbi:MAG: hypothetical protein ACQETL_03170 [Bacteroidota bacterium]|jgi:PHD/YefM family antitoxin component YafN of YafNO toxin-antitoxin module|uniref:hypothetical protein n=1 Tax=Marivirga tractuosa TaxID=1006 RepID=UPI0035CEE6B2